MQITNYLPQVNTGYNRSKNADKQETDSFGKKECETCANRAYLDRSGDSSVSFQSPTKMEPSQAAYMVRSHEQEHIKNDRTSVEQGGGEVVYQSVRLYYEICRECGTSYVAGGEARTVSKAPSEAVDLSKIFSNGVKNNGEAVGNKLDVKA